MAESKQKAHNPSDVNMDNLYLTRKIIVYLVVMFVNIIIRRQRGIPVRTFSWD